MVGGYSDVHGRKTGTERGTGESGLGMDHLDGGSSLINLASLPPSDLHSAQCPHHGAAQEPGPV